MKPEFSIFKTVKANVPTGTQTLEAFLEQVKLGKDQSILKQVMQVREAKDKTERDLLKKSLKAVSISGVFNKRDTNNLASYSGLLQIDLDHVGSEYVERVKEELNKLPFIRAVFRSPSGDGVKGIALVNGREDHEDSAKKIQEYFKDSLKDLPSTFKVDSVQDIPRLCFYSYDPELKENHEAVPFQDSMILEIKKDQKVTEPSIEKKNETISEREKIKIKADLEEALKYFPKKVQDDNRRDEVLKIIWGILDLFGEEETRRLSEKIIDPSSSFDIEQAIKSYDPNRKDRITSKTALSLLLKYKREASEGFSEIQNLTESRGDDMAIFEREKLLRAELQKVQDEIKEQGFKARDGAFISNETLQSFMNENTRFMDRFLKGEASFSELAEMGKRFDKTILIESDILLPVDVFGLLNEEANQDLGIPLPNHWKFYDEKSNGHKKNGIFMKRGLPTIIGAYSGVGKSTFLLNLLWDSLLSHNNRKAIFFSLEMTKSQIIANLFKQFIRSVHGESLDMAELKERIKNPKKNEIEDFQNKVENNLSLIYARGKTGSELLRVYDKVVQSKGQEPDQIFIDYLQIIKPESNDRDRRNQVIETTEKLTAFASDTKASWIISAQTNRESNDAKDKDFDHSSFQESSSIEQNSGLCILLRREWQEQGEVDILKVNVSKNRFGTTRIQDLEIDKKSGYILGVAEEKKK